MTYLCDTDILKIYVLTLYMDCDSYETLTARILSDVKGFVRSKSLYLIIFAIQ